MRKPHSRSFDLFDAYKHYLPGVRGMFALFGLFIAGAFIGNLVTFIIQAIVGQGVMDEYEMLITYPIQFIPPMIFASSRSARNELAVQSVPLDKWGGTAGQAILLALAAAVVTLCAAVVCEPVNAALPQMPQWLEEALKKLTEGPLWSTLICVGVFAPFFEEWLCRGIILRGLLSRMKPVWAIVISAAFFAVLHMNPWQAIPAFVAGCLLGLVYYRTGSLKMTMLMHCANNTFSVLLSRIPAFEDCDYLWQAIGNTAVYAALYAVCLCLLAIFVVRALRSDSPKIIF